MPDSIAAKEIADKGIGVFAGHRFVVENGRHVQQSGPKNSLGLVKFDMRDKQQIYLHDTPAKALFGLPERHRSHGCVRVENALQFAAMLAAQDGVVDQLQKALSSGEENYVKLKTEIPVRLVYHTAFFDRGKIQFRADVYGWDDDVAMALGLVRGGPRKAVSAAGRRRRAVDANEEGAELAGALDPPPRSRLIRSAAQFGQSPSSAGVAELGEAPFEPQPLPCRCRRGGFWR